MKCRRLLHLARIAWLPLVAVASLPCQAQTEIKPAIPVEQTKKRLFQAEETAAELSHFRIHCRYSSPSPTSLDWGDGRSQPIPKGDHTVDLTYSRTGAAPAVVRSWLDGAATTATQPPEESAGNLLSSDARLRLDRDFTIAMTFQSQGDGPLMARTTRNGKWVKGSKALFIREGNLVYDVHGAGLITRNQRVADNKPHQVLISSREGVIDFWLDGRRMSKPVRLHNADDPSHVFKIGIGAPGFTKVLDRGWVHQLSFWNESSLDHGDLEVKQPKPPGAPPTLAWSAPEPVETFDGLGNPGFPMRVTLRRVEGLEVKEAWAQPLEEADHAALIRSWSGRSLAEGAGIYQTLCATCHGTAEKQGSMPTSRKLHAEDLKNGSDPYRLFQTIHKGYGLMPPMPQLTPEEIYSAIHYLREGILKKHNESQYFPITEEYLTSLPMASGSSRKPSRDRATKKVRPYEEMDFGPSLNWTYQLNPGVGGEAANFAYKGTAIRLDPGPGGVSKGYTWAIYDHDTMRLATIYQGGFIDWRNIAFDGTHGTHTSIAGKPVFTFPDAPAWRHPVKKSWDDERFTGRDGKRYGPLPQDWVRFKGLHHYGDKVIVSYQVGDASILEMPGMTPTDQSGWFTRTLEISRSTHDLVARLSPESPDLHLALRGGDGITLGKEAGFFELRIPAASTPARVVIVYSKTPIQTAIPEPQPLEGYTKGGPSRFSATITTSGTLGDDQEAFAMDEITLPNREHNPWHSWMRVGGFDFFPDNPDRVALCTWYGEVWIVEGVSGDLTELKWKRICTGLFQPLGLKIVNDRIHVLCRDQLARLHDLNGDEEIDYVECFNNDHQVTEHFHEFAMGLQTDSDGNFYYAKSARHARPGLVPHHGTMLRVAADGSATEILATGLRAANGICITPDKRMFITDQEGEWCPKNRINLMKPGKFYGNMLGYHEITDESDAAMEDPLVWITNSFDRSPAEPVWIPREAGWGKLNEHLLNLSYGYGQAHVVTFEEAGGNLQGAICALPMARTPTGLIRGRFHPQNHQLYAAGMIAWSSNCREDGGFYRIRPTGKPAYLPVRTHAETGRFTITFSDPLPANGTFRVKTWDLLRSRSYGSPHQNEQELKIAKADIHMDTLSLSIPDLQPTRGMEIVCEFEGGIRRIIHATVHRLLDSDGE